MRVRACTPLILVLMQVTALVARNTHAYCSVCALGTEHGAGSQPRAGWDARALSRIMSTRWNAHGAAGPLLAVCVCVCVATRTIFRAA